MYVAASNNYLESWGDYEFKKGNFFLAQPTIRPLFDTIQFQDFFLKLLGSNLSFYERIKSNWQNTILKGKRGVNHYKMVIIMILQVII